LGGQGFGRGGERAGLGRGGRGWREANKTVGDSGRVIIED